jgi:hypothetical protein
MCTSSSISALHQASLYPAHSAGCFNVGFDKVKSGEYVTQIQFHPAEKLDESRFGHVVHYKLNLWPLSEKDGKPLLLVEDVSSGKRLAAFDLTNIEPGEMHQRIFVQMHRFLRFQSCKRLDAEQAKQRAALAEALVTSLFFDLGQALLESAERGKQGSTPAPPAEAASAPAAESDKKALELLDRLKQLLAK